MVAGVGVAGPVTGFAAATFLARCLFLILVLMLATWPGVSLMPRLVRAAAISEDMAFGWVFRYSATAFAAAQD